MEIKNQLTFVCIGVHVAGKWALWELLSAEFKMKPVV